MQSILALLEVIKTTAAIYSSDKVEEKNKVIAGDIMNTCLRIVQKDMTEISLAHSNVQLVK